MSGSIGNGKLKFQLEFDENAVESRRKPQNDLVMNEVQTTGNDKVPNEAKLLNDQTLGLNFEGSPKSSGFEKIDFNLNKVSNEWSHDHHPHSQSLAQSSTINRFQINHQAAIQDIADVNEVPTSRANDESSKAMIRNENLRKTKPKHLIGYRKQQAASTKERLNEKRFDDYLRRFRLQKLINTGTTNCPMINACGHNQ